MSIESLRAGGLWDSETYDKVLDGVYYQNCKCEVVDAVYDQIILALTPVR